MSDRPNLRGRPTRRGRRTSWWGAICSLGPAVLFVACEEKGILPPAPPAAPDVVLNELLADAESLSFGECGSSDWIELLNRGETAVALADLRLSDTPGVPDLWTPTVSDSLIPGERVVVCADDLNDGLHASFRLSAAGESVYLRWMDEEEGITLLDSVAYPALEPDQAYARIPDGVGDWTITPTPTPGEVNQ